MSGFASKLSAAGTRGWKDLQSLWGEPKTTLTSADTSPGEKSSLLGKSSFNHGEESSKSNLLDDDDESWADWTQESASSSSKNSSTTSNKTKLADWSTENEDDFEIWLNDDTSALSVSDKSKNRDKTDPDWDNWPTNNSSKSPLCVKSSNSSSKSKKKSPKTLCGRCSPNNWDAAASWDTELSTTTSQQSEPLVGNLLDLEDGNGLAESSTGKGWDNEVWVTESEDKNDWPTLDLTGNSNKVR